MWESVQTDETTDTKSKVQTKLQFDSSDVSPIKTEVIEEDSGKIPPSFSQTFNRKNKKKKTKRSKHKKVKKARRRQEYSSDFSSSSSEEDTRHTREHSGGSLPYFTRLYRFPGQPQGYHNPNAILLSTRTTLSANERNSTRISVWPILITTLCKIRICVTLCRLESQT